MPTHASSLPLAPAMFEVAVEFAECRCRQGQLSESSDWKRTSASWGHSGDRGCDRSLRGETDSAEVRFRDGARLGIPVSEITQYVSEPENPDNAEGVGAVSARSGILPLPRNPRLRYDGLESAFAHNTEAFQPTGKSVWRSIPQPVNSSMPNNRSMSLRSQTRLRGNCQFDPDQTPSSPTSRWPPKPDRSPAG